MARNSRAKHTDRRHVTYTASQDIKLRLITGPNSGFMVHVVSKKQEYINLEIGGWYTLVVKSALPVKIVAVESSCMYRGDNSRRPPQWVKYNVTNQSGTPPEPVVPVDVPDTFHGPTPATRKLDKPEQELKKPKRERKKHKQERKKQRQERKKHKQEREAGAVQQTAPKPATRKLKQPKQEHKKHKQEREPGAAQQPVPAPATRRVSQRTKAVQYIAEVGKAVKDSLTRSEE